MAVLSFSASSIHNGGSLSFFSLHIGVHYLFQPPYRGRTIFSASHIALLFWTYGSHITSMKCQMDLAKIYYSLKGYWKGLTANKKLASAAKVSEDVAKDWLKKQAIWQIYLPAPRHIPRPKFDVSRAK